MSIPKIIHLVEPAHNVLSVWQNTHPDWQCIEWSVEGCYAFIKRYYPTAVEAYLRLTTQQQRVHFSWYYLLHRYGGVAVEGNRVPKKKIEGLFLSLYDLYLIEDWFIASVPQTEFLESAIETLPTLEPKWYDRFVGSLVRSTATVLPDTPYKRHPPRVYSNYFHPLQHTGLSKLKILLIVVLLFLVFHLVKIITNKDKLEMWKLRWRIFFPKRVQVTTTTSSDSSSSSASPLTPLPAANDSAILPDLDVLKSSSIANLEKSLLPAMPTPYVPPIRIPPINPPTPSSISFTPSSELTITPFAEEELVIPI
jgi:hypothetical protein